MLMRVYRIQDDDGFGPYCPYDRGVPVSQRRVRIAKYLDLKHVGPLYRHDVELSDKESEAHCYFFGFRTLDALKEWFRGDLQLLYENGFKCYVYDVKKRYTRRGKHQLAFNIRQSRVEKILSLDDLG